MNRDLNIPIIKGSWLYQAQVYQQISKCNKKNPYSMKYNCVSF